jgi:hypothetical protein
MAPIISQRRCLRYLVSRASSQAAFDWIVERTHKSGFPAVARTTSLFTSDHVALRRAPEQAFAEKTVIMRENSPFVDRRKAVQVHPAPSA